MDCLWFGYLGGDREKSALNTQYLPLSYPTSTWPPTGKGQLLVRRYVRTKVPPNLDEFTFPSEV